MKSSDFRVDYLKRLRDPKYARGLLKTTFDECMEDNNWEAFGLLLQDIIDARGSKSDFAKKVKLSRQHLYRLFAKNANPTLSTLRPVLSGLGFRLTLSE